MYRSVAVINLQALLSVNWALAKVRFPCQFRREIPSALDLPAYIAQALTEYPVKGSLEPVIPTDPLIYRFIAAERNGQKIAVEVKSFIGTSTIFEFHTALGQFINYRYALEVQEPERVLYLAVPSNAYNDFLQNLLFNRWFNGVKLIF